MKKTYSYDECYKILGLTENCEWSDIRLAYKKLIQKWHPDRFETNSESKSAADSKIKSINIAHHQLSAYYRKNKTLPQIETAEPTNKKPEVQTVKSNKSSSTKTKRIPPKPSINKKKPIKTSLILVTLLGGYWFFSDININYLLNFDLTHFLNANMGIENTYDSEDSHDEEINHQHGYNDNKTLPPQATRDISEHADQQPHQNTQQTLELGSDSIENETLENPDLYFTYGSSMGEVIVAQGAPTKTIDDVWYYGESEVHFENGKVIKWVRKIEQPLKAKLQTY